MTTGQSDQEGATKVGEHLRKDGSIDIDAIYDLPTTELTEREIDALVEYKSDVKARDSQFEQLVKAVQESGDKQVQALKDEYAQARKQQEDLLSAAMANLEAARREAEAWAKAITS